MKYVGSSVGSTMRVFFSQYSADLAVRQPGGRLIGGGGSMNSRISSVVNRFIVTSDLCQMSIRFLVYSLTLV